MHFEWSAGSRSQPALTGVQPKRLMNVSAVEESVM